MRAAILLAVPTLLAPLAGQDAPKSRAERIELARLDRAIYHLLPPTAEQPPEKGYGLVVVLPGGDGGRDDPTAFLPFVENGIHAHAVPDDHVTALAAAVRWTDDQEIVWPTADAKVRGAEWTTERYLDALIDDVARRVDIDRERVTLLGWSSSGPAVWATLLQRRRPAARGYVAMSVFRPKARSERFADGLRIVLDQSPEDRVTPFRFAETARTVLGEHDAAVWLRRYAGGHGWHDAPLPRIAAGLRWLDGDEPPPVDETEVAATGPDRVANGGFEQGLAGWQVIANSGRLEAEPDGARKASGDRALHLSKTGGMPLDLVRQDVDLAGAAQVTVSAWVAAKGAKNAFVKFFAYDDDDQPVFDDVDLLQIRGDRDGATVSKTWRLDGRAKRGAVMLVMVMGGEVWVDDVAVRID